MKKYIAEDLPVRKHPQAQMSSQSKDQNNSDQREKKLPERGESSSPDKKIRQAVYDIKYRARRENLPLRTAYSQYMQNSSMSEMEKSEVRKRLFGKEGGVQAEDFQVEMQNFASRSMADALYKVFVENKHEVINIYQLKNELEEAANEASESRKYKIRVKDPKNDVTYVRYATREKINQLRQKGLEVEMTEHGTPYEGERKKGEQTASALGGGGKAKKDYDGDGKIESGAKEHAGAVHNAIQRKKGGVPDGKDTSSVREEFVREIAATANLPQVDSTEYITPDTNLTQIDFATKKNKIVVNPTDSSNTKLMSHHELEGELISENGYSRFLRLLQEKKMTAAKKQKEKKLKKKYDKSGMKASMKDQYGEEKGKKVYFATIRKQAMKEESDCKDNSKVEDERSLPTKKSLIASKFQSMGVKNPIVMSAGYEPEGEVLDERTRERKERGEPRPDPNSLKHRVMMDVRSRNPGLMTRGGQTVAQHKAKRGVKKDRTSPVVPQGPSETPAEKVAKRRANTASAKEMTRSMYKPRAGESD